MRPLVRLTAVLAIGAWLASPSGAWPAGHWSDLFRPAKPPHPAVVRIIAPNGNSLSLGSGALVAVNGQHGLVVTNWHVVRDATGVIQVAFPDGFRSPALVLKTDAQWDLAALAIWRPRVEPIPLASQAPRPGEPLTIAGYGSGVYREVTGRCTQYVAPDVNQPFEMVELSARARQGDSGGPILNARGELAGVLFGASFSETTGSYCGRVRQFLASVAGDFQRLQPVDTVLAGYPPPAPATQGAVGGPGGSAGGLGSASSSAAVPATFATGLSASGWRPIAGTGPAAPSVSAAGGLAPPVGPPARLPERAGLGPMASSGPPPSAVAQARPGPAAEVLPLRAPEAAIAGRGPAVEPAQPAHMPPLDASAPGEPAAAPADTWFEQGRNVLAALGALAVFFHGLRLVLPPARKARGR